MVLFKNRILVTGFYRGNKIWVWVRARMN